MAVNYLRGQVGQDFIKPNDAPLLLDVFGYLSVIRNRWDKTLSIKLYADGSGEVQQPDGPERKGSIIRSFGSLEVCHSILAQFARDGYLE
jgi:hypothetical protein